MASDVSYTYEDYARLPEGAPVQLIGGQLVVSPSPSTWHQTVLLRLAFHLHRYCEATGLGTTFIAPVDVLLSSQDVVQPDIAVISAGRQHIVEDRLIRGAPDLVVEILSTSTAEHDLQYKKGLYARHGVREYWIVDPHARIVDQYVAGEDAFAPPRRIAPPDELISSSLSLPGVSLEHVFRAPQTR